MARTKSGVDVDVEDARSPIEIAAQFPSIANSRYFTEYTTRLAYGRDMHTIVTAEGETGVGKTTLAFVICMLLDFHGWSADKATLDPFEYASMYDDHPPGTWLLGDEWELAMDARRSSSTQNVELSRNYAGKRYRQIFSCVTLPSKGWLDKRLGISAADFWIQCLEGKGGRPKGVARVYRIREEEHYETSITKKTETIKWPVMDTHPELKKIHRLKEERFEGADTQKYVHIDEFKEAKKNFWNKATKKARYDMVKAMNQGGISQTDISQIMLNCDFVEPLSQSRISELVNSDSFEDIYET